MRVHFILVFLFALLSSISFSVYSSTEELMLMPYPQSVVQGDGYYQWRTKVKLKIQSEKDRERIASIVNRYKAQLNAYAVRESIELSKGYSKIKVYISEGGNSDLFPDERYNLKITRRGISIKAESVEGLNRALSTMLQLSEKRENQLYFPYVEINDAPKYTWRGLLLDTSRNYFSVATIKRQLDAMASAKLNVFHWHLTDDQGWRLESKRYPRLTSVASEGQYYTQSQIRDVIAYAADRGIQVLPEIDFPGHTSAFAVAYPELMSKDMEYSMTPEWGVHKPLLDPTNPAVYELIDGLVEEMTELFPFPYIHIGGDEVNPAHWRENRKIQQFMKENNIEDFHGLHLYFNERVAKIFQKHNRKLIGWDEILHDDLSKEFVVQSWRGHDSLIDAASKGYKSILSTGFYLDQPQSAAYHYRNFLVPEKQPVPSLLPENYSYWSFRIPRKRGSAVTGKLAFSDDSADPVIIEFRNKPAEVANQSEHFLGMKVFWLDTWMGKTEFRLNMVEDKSKGKVKVGNAFYDIHLTKIKPEKFRIRENVVNTQLQKNVIGGEAALWTELVDENSIDNRLWPRVFVVAERLWSGKNHVDEEFMYRRLEQLVPWSEAMLDLKHLKQSENRLLDLAGTDLLASLLMLQKAVEPGHYYHRHHEKSVYHTYSRRDTLDRFVDSLPAENLYQKRLRERLISWLGNKNEQDIRVIRQFFNDAIKNQEYLSQQTIKGQRFAEVLEISGNAASVARMGLNLIEMIQKGEEVDHPRISALYKQTVEQRRLLGETVCTAAELNEILLKYIESELLSHQK
ncbi:beta-N-acetylhexosaminidase [Teredinibacter sp. KSP-S5-2]|uniref:beta-N-acetylhexosaminidase n=1 Tax=Teredinibacter sp. KSP-S5-2 TaxID=3034506 RepID=UPI002934B682|nr:family 20 glycosylhydrolase [Teredinibacter sp. KSP-S5-2]WNO07694.1 family 20 glycosylhydrolase [Teredinibacter sp. KSP-S5-2]